MVDVPATMPVNIPEVEPTVTEDILLLVQVPPPVASLRLAVKPTQTNGVPDMAAGTGYTVTTDVVRQPVPNL